MAFVSKELKAKIATKLKTVVPKDWKYSLAVVDGKMTIQMTIASAPVDLINERKHNVADGYFTVNQYRPEFDYTGDTLAVIKSILEVLNLDNHNNSDVQSDYFDVGHYVDLRVGKYEKPFTVK
ncbi:MAG: hypothetical protein ACRC3J_09135 [Culicoidibacterales bacterium]